MRKMAVGRKKIGLGQPCFVIAEIGNNHDCDMAVAKKLIRICAQAGADAVKFQTFRGSDIVSPLVKADAYPDWKPPKRYKYWHEYLDSFVLPRDWYDELIAYAGKNGVAFISSVPSVESAEFLKKKNVAAIKIASMDMNNIPLLEKLPGLKLPVIISTGMATLEEIGQSLHALGKTPVALMHAVSNYPAIPDELNLNNITMLQDVFGVPVGFSDHSLGTDSAIAAVALGAAVIEKHVTLSRSRKGPDHFFSLEPGEFKEMIDKIRITEKSLGSYRRELGPKEKRNRMAFRRSLQVNRTVKAGEVLNETDIAVLRPGCGIEPKYLNDIVGCDLKRNLKPFSLLQWTDVACRPKDPMANRLPHKGFLLNSQFLRDLSADQIYTAWSNLGGKVDVLGDSSMGIFYSLKDMKWDSRFLGINCGMLDVLQIPDCQNEIRLRVVLEASGYDFILARVNASDYQANRLITNAGADLVSVKHLFRLGLESPMKRLALPDGLRFLNPLEVRRYRGQIGALAVDNLKHGRFFQDRSFGSDTAAAIYKSWAKNLFKDSKTRIYVTLDKKDRNVAGFAAVSVKSLDIGEGIFSYAFLELIAVSKNRRGLGKVLFAEVLSDMKRSGCKILYANTPASNVEAVSFYYRRGFECVGALNEYHWHSVVKPGESW